MSSFLSFFFICSSTVHFSLDNIPNKFLIFHPFEFLTFLFFLSPRGKMKGFGSTMSPGDCREWSDNVVFASTFMAPTFLCDYKNYEEKVITCPVVFLFEQQCVGICNERRSAVIPKFKLRCYHKTVDFATAASQNRGCITQGKFHKMI